MSENGIALEHKIGRDRLVAQQCVFADEIRRAYEQIAELEVELCAVKGECRANAAEAELLHEEVRLLKERPGE